MSEARPRSRLALHQVDPVGLGYRSVHLDAGVHLDRLVARSSIRNSTVPALVYPAFIAGLSEALAQSLVTLGDGDSSINFWCRRWMELSRSPESRYVLVGQHLKFDVTGASFSVRQRS
jgi:hypothetical protein